MLLTVKTFFFSFFLHFRGCTLLNKRVESVPPVSSECFILQNVIMFTSSGCFQTSLELLEQHKQSVSDTQSDVKNDSPVRSLSSGVMSGLLFSSLLFEGQTICF